MALAVICASSLGEVDAANGDKVDSLAVMLLALYRIWRRNNDWVGP